MPLNCLKSVFRQCYFSLLYYKREGGHPCLMVLKLILAAKRLKINTESFRKCACGQVDIDLALKLNFKGGSRLALGYSHLTENSYLLANW